MGKIIDWERIKHEFVSVPESTYKSTAKKFSVHYKTLARVAKRDNWRQQKSQFHSKVDEVSREKEFENLVDLRVTRNKEHQQIAQNAVIIAQSLLNDLAKNLKNKIPIDPFTANRVFHALDKAIMLERVTHNLATSVAKADVTSGGESLNMRRVFDDPKLIAIAIQVGITDSQLASIGIRATSDHQSKRKG